MKNLKISFWVLLGFVLFAFILCLSTSSSAQIFTYNPFFSPIDPFFLSAFNPAYAFPFVPPVPVYSAPVLNPLLSPFPVLPTFPYRTAAATIVVLPPPAPTVTAYAPLGTLNLTPSTLVFLILFLTLAE